MSLLALLPTPAAGSSGLPLLLSPRPTLNAADIAAIAAAVLAAAAVSPIKANIKQVNDLTVDGTGTEADPWGPV